MTLFYFRSVPFDYVCGVFLVDWCDLCSFLLPELSAGLCVLCVYVFAV